VLCPSCGHENREGATFCGGCAAPLADAIACANCGTSNPSGQKFCDACAAALEAAAPLTRTPTPVPSPTLPVAFAGGRYQVQRFLGEGGRKRVYLAHDTKLDRDVAIAVIKTEGLDAAGLSRVQREAQAMGRLGDHPHIVGEVLASKTLHHHYYMQVQDAVEAGREAADLLRSAGAFWDLGDTLWATQLALVLLGRFDEVVQIGDELEPLVAQAGLQGALLTARRARAYAELCRTADLDRWEQFARADLETCQSGDMGWVTFASYLYVASAHFWRGRWQQAMESHQEAYQQEPLGPYAAFGWSALFALKAYCGDREEALALLEEKRANLPRAGQPNPWGAWDWLFRAVEGLAVLGEPKQAARLYPMVLEAMDTGTLTDAIERLPETVAGIAAACGQQWKKAEEHYEKALRQAHELPVVIAQPEVRRWYARMLIDRDAPGNCDKARELLTEAIAMYRKIGMPKHVEMAEALLREV